MALRSFNHKSLAQQMGDVTVEVFVGPAHKRYVVHKGLLTKGCRFFDRALNGNFREADENSVCLEEEDPAAFDLLVGWLYQGRIPAIGPPFVRSKTFGVEEESSSGITRQPENPYEEPAFRRVISTYLPTSNEVAMGSRHHVPYPGVNHGTGHVAFRARIEQSSVFGGGIPIANGIPGANLDRIEHISAQDEYRPWSVEELRGADYTSNKTWKFHLIPHTYANRPSPEMSYALLALQDPESANYKNLIPTIPFANNGRINGIPECPSLSKIIEIEENHQIALLSLCLLAETICWDKLFNAAMTAYISGEATLSPRALPVEHISLIYTRAHSSSPCRIFAADSAISHHLGNIVTQALYAQLAQDYPAFLEDIFARLGVDPVLQHRDPTREKACTYHVHAEGEACTLTTFTSELDLHDGFRIFSEV